MDRVIIDSDGHVTEGTTSNLFMVSGGRVITPPLEAGILSGITRAKVLELCATVSLPHSERSFGADALFAADEVFITSTTRDVMPVTKIDARAIGTGRPGPLTKRLMAAYRDLCDRAAAATAPSAHPGR